MRLFLLVTSLFLASVVATLPLQAAPRSYTLDPDKTEVGFTYKLGEISGRGTMPVDEARLLLDFRQVSRSEIDVTMDAVDARADLPFVGSAMRGETVLDTARFPKIRFESTQIKAAQRGATVTGRLTVRDVTRSVTLSARFFRQPDRDPADLSRLTILMQGEINRNDFGASGWAGTVGETIGLRILATIDRQN